MDIELIEKACKFMGLDNNDSAAYDKMEICLDMAQEDIFAYCHIEELPDGLKNTLITMGCFKYNTIQGLGLTGASYSGIREDYATTYPASVTSSMQRYRRAQFR